MSSDPMREHERVHAHAQHFLQDRQARADGGAEVALQHAGEPGQVLGVPGLGHAHRLAQPCPRLGRRLLAFEQHAEGISRRKVEDDEDHEAHAEQQERRDHQLPGQDQGYGADGG